MSIAGLLILADQTIQTFLLLLLEMGTFVAKLVVDYETKMLHQYLIHTPIGVDLALDY